MSSSVSRPVPPVAKKTPKTIEQLGRKRTDDYAWMKDDNWQAVLREVEQVSRDIRRTSSRLERNMVCLGQGSSRGYMQVPQHFTYA